MSVDMDEYERLVAERLEAEERRADRTVRLMLIGAGLGVVWILARVEALPDSVVLLVSALLVFVPLLRLAFRRT